MIHQIRKFWNDESGPELVEWAVVTIILLVAAVILYIAVGEALGAVICAIKCWLEAVMGDHSEINEGNCQEDSNECAD
jgi:Flp pilus assembly pilin Flp